MKIFLNGRELLVHDKTTIDELLKNLKTDKLKTVIQLSGEILRQESISTRKLKEGDEIEIISFVGGG